MVILWVCRSLCLNILSSDALLQLCIKSCDTGYLTDTGQIVFANNSKPPGGRQLIYFLKYPLWHQLQTASIICSAVESTFLYLMIFFSRFLSVLPHLCKLVADFSRNSNIKQQKNAVKGGNNYFFWYFKCLESWIERTLSDASFIFARYSLLTSLTCLLSLSRVRVCSPTSSASLSNCLTL